eukprot:scaffold23504_cov71-Phaeocystis_antarctica.AAC.3
MFIPHKVQGGRLPRYIPHPFQNCHDGHPSAVAGHADTCLTAQRSFGCRAAPKQFSPPPHVGVGDRHAQAVGCVANGQLP